ncbi:MAG: hypothetical protein ABI809_14555 [Caldimonas sp.]
MNDQTVQSRYDLRFESLVTPGFAFEFPCDADGHVNMDALTDTVRENYLYARTVVGREYALPIVIGAVALTDGTASVLRPVSTPDSRDATFAGRDR